MGSSRKNKTGRQSKTHGTDAPKDVKSKLRIETFLYIMWALGLVLDFGLVLYKLVLPDQLKETRFDYLLITLLVFLLFPSLRKFKAFGIEYEAERIEQVEDRVEAMDSRLKALPDYIQGDEYYEQKDYQLARRSLEKSAKADPTFWPAIFFLGTVAYDQERYDDAINAFKGVLKLDQENVYAMNNLAEVYLEAPFPYFKPDLALEYAEKALALIDDFASAILYKCQALNRLGRYKDAANLLAQLKDKDAIPDQKHWVMYELALANSNLGIRMNPEALDKMHEIALNYEEGEKFIHDLNKEIKLFNERERGTIRKFLEKHREREIVEGNEV